MLCKNITLFWSCGPDCILCIHSPKHGLILSLQGLEQLDASFNKITTLEGMKVS